MGLLNIDQQINETLADLIENTDMNVDEIRDALLDKFGEEYAYIFDDAINDYLE